MGTDSIHTSWKIKEREKEGRLNVCKNLSNMKCAIVLIILLAVYAESQGRRKRIYIPRPQPRPVSVVPRTTDDDFTQNPTHGPVTDDDFTRRPRPSDSTRPSRCANKWSMLKVRGRRGRRIYLRCYYPMLRLKFVGFEVPNADNAVSISKVSFIRCALFCKKRRDQHVMYIPDEGQCYCSNGVARRGEKRSDTLYYRFKNAGGPTHSPRTTNEDFTRHPSHGQQTGEDYTHQSTQGLQTNEDFTHRPTRGSRTDDKR